MSGINNLPFTSGTIIINPPANTTVKSNGLTEFYSTNSKKDTSSNNTELSSRKRRLKYVGIAVIGLVGLLGLACLPSSYIFRNQFGKKGLNNFLENPRIPNRLKYVTEKLKQIPGAERALEETSSWNLRLFTEEIMNDVNVLFTELKIPGSNEVQKFSAEGLEKLGWKDDYRYLIMNKGKAFMNEARDFIKQYHPTVIGGRINGNMIPR